MWFGKVSYDVCKYAKLLGSEGISVYTVLCLHADKDTGECFPAYETIAKESGVARSTVALKIKELDSIGLITFVRKGGGRGNPNIYKVVALETVRATDGLPLKHPQTVRTTKINRPSDGLEQSHRTYNNKKISLKENATDPITGADLGFTLTN